MIVVAVVDLVIALVLLANVVDAAGSCNALFPANGGVYAEQCMFNGYGTFTSSTIGYNNKYYLLSIDLTSASTPDLEHYVLTSIGSPTFNASVNCQVQQDMYVYEYTKGQFVLEASSNATNVNVFGPNVLITPGVVSSPGACFMTRQFSNACFQLGLDVQRAFAKRGVQIPIDVHKACTVL